MISGWWAERATSERLAGLRREAEHQRLLRLGHRGGKARRLRLFRWHGGVVRIRAARIRLQHRSPWLGPEVLTQRGDRS
jgi:hypothetical protein